MINRGEREQLVTLHPDDIPQGADGESPITLDQTLIDVLTGDEIVPQDGKLETRMLPMSARLYLRK
ncbi:MAG: hypothetical protein R2881_01040 [Eubacteriales bacterium]